MLSRPFLTPRARQALAQSVHELHAASCAELLIAVRGRSGRYPQVPLVIGIAAGWAVLAWLVFSSVEFAPLSLVVDPLLSGGIAGLVASRFPVLYRLLTRESERRAAVQAAARSTFLLHHVHRKAGRTGILLYISLLEREVEAVVDLGVEALAATPAWRQALAEIERVVRRGGDGLAVAGEVQRLADLLAPTLVAAPGDAEELVEEVCE